MNTNRQAVLSGVLPGGNMTDSRKGVHHRERRWAAPDTEGPEAPSAHEAAGGPGGTGHAALHWNSKVPR